MLRNTLKIFPQASCMLAGAGKHGLQKSCNRINAIEVHCRKYSTPSAASALYLSSATRRLLSHKTSTSSEHHYSDLSIHREQPEDKLYARICCELRCNDPEVMKSYSTFATMAARHLNIEVGECYAQKKAHHERYTLLRSVHVVKRCRVQYEVRTYFRWMNFHKLTGSTADTFLEYIQRNLPEGVALKVTKYELQRLPSHLVPPAVLESAGQVAVEDGK